MVEGTPEDRVKDIPTVLICIHPESLQNLWRFLTDTQTLKKFLFETSKLGFEFVLEIILDLLKFEGKDILFFELAL